MIYVIMAACLWLAEPSPLRQGAGQIEVDLGPHRIEVFTYKPFNYHETSPMVIVFHGVARDAETYRNHAQEMGDRFAALIVAPRFDARQFSSRRYHRGGLLREDGAVAPREEWTWNLVPRLIAEIRQREGRPDQACYLIGHSAGGQFLSRMAGFVTTDALRIVVANPSAHLLPSREHRFPYGYDGLPEQFGDTEQLRRHLAQPLTIYLGTGDTERDRDLDKCAEADKQGSSRLERGRNAFRAAEQLARERGWEFGWRLVEAPGVGHDHQAMFNAPQCETALFGPRVEAVTSATPAGGLARAQQGH